MSLPIRGGDVLLVVDAQNDFVDGTLAVPGAARILPVIEGCVELFEQSDLPVVATRDWHPPMHCSFRERGGPWPAHCVQATRGAALAGGLASRTGLPVVSKGMDAGRDAYSGFDGTSLDALLRELGARRLFVCGLATDYCIRATVLDALRLGYEALVVSDAIAAVNAREGDGARAIAQMRGAGARFVDSGAIALAGAVHG